MQGSENLSIMGSIRKYLPTFCWQSMDQIITMMEQIDEDINEYVSSNMFNAK